MAKFNPDVRHPLYDAWFPTWTKCGDAYDGEEAVKMKAEVYLPRPSGFSKAKDPAALYNGYMLRAQVPEIYSPAVRGLAGIIHAKPATVELPTSMEVLLEVCTKDRQPLDVFHQRASIEVLKKGRFGVLVDAPVDGGDPYLAGYIADQIIDWDTNPDTGAVTYVVLDESLWRRNSEGEWVAVERWRVGRIIDEQYLESLPPEALLPPGVSIGVYIVEVWERGGVDNSGVLRTGDATLVDVVVPSDARQQALVEIPFVFIDTMELTPSPDDAPLYGVATAELAIYRMDADYRHALYLTSQPTPVAIGVDPENAPDTIGSAAIWIIAQGGDAKMLEFSGQGVGAMKIAMDDDYARAVQAGARLLSTSDEGGPESGEALRLRQGAQTATITTVAKNTAAGLERALRYAAMMLGQDPESVSVEANTDFVELRLSSLDIAALVDSWLKGAISKETMFTNLQRGDIVPENVTFEDEEERIEAGKPDVAEPVPPPAPAPAPAEDANAKPAPAEETA
jgi:hypothetical protein